MTSHSHSNRKAVLLLHGASANHGTFEIHEGGLAKYLAREGFDPWLLDWRGSSLVVEDEFNKKRPADSFNFNDAAAYDIPLAIAKVRKEGQITGPIAAVGHCMGSGVSPNRLPSGTSPATIWIASCF